MSVEWSEASVLELQQAGVLLVEDGNHGEYRPRRPEFCDDGTAFIRAADMAEGRVLFERASRINAVALARIRKGIGRPGDALLSHKGTVGKTAYAREGCDPFVCSPQTTFWRAAPGGLLDGRYLYYFLCSPALQNQLVALKGETDMADYVSLTNQRRLRVFYPPIDEQRRIAAVLGALDDKIELNRKMNRTLEEMAQAIFKSWFIDFDGHDDLVESELGPIPRGWAVATLDEFIKLDKGLSYKSKLFDDAGLPLVNLKCIARGGGFRRDGLKYYAGDFKEKHVVAPGDVVVAMTDLTQKREVVASAALVPNISGRAQILMSLDLSCPRPKPPLTNLWLYHRLQTTAFKSFARGFANGTTVLHLKLDGVKRFRFALPPADHIRAFTELATPLHARVSANEEQEPTLQQLRDTLLPKLISGEIRVPDAEEAAEAAS